MIVTCKECDSSFNVGDSLIKADGSKVRCSKCASVFVVYPDTSDSLLGEDPDDLSLDMDEDLGLDLDSDDEMDDFAIEDSADDDLPELDDMMDFDDDDLAVEQADEEAAGDPDLDMDEDDLLGFGETETLDEEELDLEEESVAEAIESELDDFEEKVRYLLETQTAPIETAAINVAQSVDVGLPAVRGAEHVQRDERRQQFHRRGRIPRLIRQPLQHGFARVHVLDMDAQRIRGNLANLQRASYTDGQRILSSTHLWRGDQRQGQQGREKAISHPSSPVLASGAAMLGEQHDA